MNNNANTITARLHNLYAIIRQAEIKYQRSPNSIELVAISKTRSIAEIEEAIAGGQLAFGENYVQEALPKIIALNQRHSNLVWHYTGRIQSNKTKYLAGHFHWVQSVAKIEHAAQLSKHRAACVAETKVALQICIEINLNEEESKSGIGVAEEDSIISLARAITQLPHLKLRGLMAIPAPATNFAQQFANFEKLAQIYLHLKEEIGLPLDTLSMGMSDDFVAAIAAGATMLRIGTSIFGER